jgi:hypothetical protein
LLVFLEAGFYKVFSNRTAFWPREAWGESWVRLICRADAFFHRSELQVLFDFGSRKNRANPV